MKKVLINVEERELRVAILEDDQLVELYIESLDEKSILNNIYKGRIEGILPGLKAAFVNVGLEKNAFLHFDDVRPDLLWQKYREMNPDMAENVPTAREAMATRDQDDESGREEDGEGRRNRRGKRGGKRQRPTDEAQYTPGLPVGISEDELDESDDETDAAEAAPSSETPSDDTTETPSAEPAASDSGTQPRLSAREERQRRRRERWEQKKLERQAQRQKQRQEQTQQQNAAFLPPPAGTAPHGSRAAANPYDVFSPYSKPSGGNRKQKQTRWNGNDNFGNVQVRHERRDNRDSQVDFFGPVIHNEAAETSIWDERQPDFNQSGLRGRGRYELSEANGNEAGPGQSRQNRNDRNKRQGAKRRGGRRRTMKRRNNSGGQSFYAARAPKSADAASTEPELTSDTPIVSEETKTPKKTVRKSAAKKTTDGETAARTPARTRTRRKTAVDAETPAGEKTEKKPSTRARKAAPSAETEFSKPVAPVDSTSADAVQEPKSTSRRKPASRKKTVKEPVQADLIADAEARSVPAPVSEPDEKPAPHAKETAEGGEEKSSASATGASIESPAEEKERKAGRRGRRGPKDRRRGAAKEEAPSTETGESSGTGEGSPPVATEAASGEAGSSDSTGVQKSPEAGAREDEGRSARRNRRGGKGRNGRDRRDGQQLSGEDDKSRTAGEPSDSKGRKGSSGREQSQRSKSHKRRPPLFPEVFKKGDELMVQVVKEEIGMKGARISTYVSLPGRYLVLLPYPNEEGGVSRKVEDAVERKRLKTLLRDISTDKTAFIVRTAGIYRPEEDIRQDVQFLSGEWEQIDQHFVESEPTRLVYDDHDILYRLARDVFDENISEIIIDSHTEMEKLKGILGKLIPGLVDKVKVYSGTESIFNKYQVEKQIQKAARRKVWLKSGGYLIIDEAEALTAIDVNTGKSVGKDDQEKLILKTNLEASRAVARELKLRDIGGLIVIDFIDMKDMRNREQVLSELKAQLRKDRSKTSVSAISEFGLVEMTRKRVRRSLRKTLFMDCPYCQGAGVVLNEQQIWLHIKNDLVRHLEGTRGTSGVTVSITVNPKIRAYLDQSYREVIRRLEQKYDAEIRVQMSDAFHIENYLIENVDGSPQTVSAGSGGR